MTEAHRAVAIITVGIRAPVYQSLGHARQRLPCPPVGAYVARDAAHDGIGRAALDERRRRSKLDAMKLGVNAVARDQVRMCAVFDDAPGIEHRDAVDAFDGG